MKTFVITVSRWFMQGHPRQGEPTYFKEKILDGEKLHTHRDNFKFWLPRVQDAIDGEAVFSLREWTGKPYASKQKEFLLTSNVGIEPFQIDEKGDYKVLGNTQRPSIVRQIANNDGLRYDDFIGWFRKFLCAGPYTMDGGIIWFNTSFRYGPSIGTDGHIQKPNPGQ